MAEYRLFMGNDGKTTIIANENDPDEFEGFSLIGSFDHCGATDHNGYCFSHVIWHHLRDLLYKEGIYNCSLFSVYRGSEDIPVGPPEYITLPDFTGSMKVDQMVTLNVGTYLYGEPSIVRLYRGSTVIQTWSNPEDFPPDYTLTMSDKDKLLKIGTTVVGAGGTMEFMGPARLVTEEEEPDIPAPTNLTKPTITGTPVVGQTIAQCHEFSVGTWDGEVNDYTTVIKLGGVVVSPSYTYNGSEDGKNLVSIVTANGPMHSTSETSDPLVVSFVSVPVISTLPSLTDVQTDGGMQTLDPGVWTNGAQSYKLEYTSGGVVPGDGTYLINEGDAFPERAYVEATEAGKIRLLKVTAYTGLNQTGNASDPEYSPIRVAVPKLIHTLGEGLAGVALIDASDWPFDCIDKTGAPFSAAIDKRFQYQNGKAEITGYLQNGHYYLCQFDGIVNEVEFEVPVTEIVAKGNIANGLYYCGINVCASVYDGGTGYTGVYVDLRNQNTAYRLTCEVWLRGVFVTGSTKYIDIPKADVTGNPVVKVERRVSGGVLQYRAIVNDDETKATAWSVAIEDADLTNHQDTIRVFPSASYAPGETGGWPQPVFNSLIVETLPSKSISASVIDTEISPISPDQSRFTLSGAVNGAVTNIKYAVALDDGTLIADYGADIAVVDGNISFTVDAPLSDGEQGIIYICDATDPTIVTSVEFTALVLPKVFPTSIGLNIGGGQTGRVWNNMMDNFELRTQGGGYPDAYYGGSTGKYSMGPTGFDVNSIGFPTKIPTGDTYFEIGADYAWPSDPDSDVLGSYILEFHPSLNWQLYARGWFTIVDDRRSEGWCEILVGDVGLGTVPIFRIYGLPSNAADCYMRMYKKGYNSSQKEKMYRPQMISYLQPFKPLRFMDQKNTNRAPDLAPIGPEKLTLGDNFSSRLKPIGPKQMLQIAREEGSIVWDCLNDMMNGPAVRAYAQYIKDNLLLGEEYIIEYSNECGWNWGFQQSQNTMRNCINYSAGSYALQENDYIKGTANGVDRVVQINKQYVKTGTIGGSNATGYILIATDMSNKGGTAWNMPFDLGTAFHHCDSNGNVLHSNIATMAANSDYVHLFYARKLNWIIEQFETVFGPMDPKTSPVKFVACWQAFGGETAMEALLLEENLISKIRYFGDAPYGENFGDYSNATYMSEADRDLVVSDPALFKTKYAAAMTAAAKTATDVFKTRTLFLATLCKEQGLDADAVIHVSYECSPQHQLEANTPWMQFTNGNCTYGAALDGGNIKGGGAYTLRGKTSNARARLGGSHGRGSTVKTGTFAGGNATGYVTRGNQASGTFQIGEDCDLYVWNNDPAVELAAGPVQTNVIKISAMNNIQLATRQAWAEFWDTPEFGNIFKTYLTNLTPYGGIHCIYQGHGDDPLGSNMWNYADYGRWNISAFIEDQTQNPYSSIIDWIE